MSDGICDCCDGADEPISADCPDVCGAALASERADRDRAVSEFREGSEKRIQGGVVFERAMEVSTSRMNELSGSGSGSGVVGEGGGGGVGEGVGIGIIPGLEAELSDLNDSFRGIRSAYLADRERAASGIAEPLLEPGVADAVTEDEVRSFIVYACQLAGEIASYSVDDAEDGGGGGEGDDRTHAQQAYMRRPRT